MYWNGFVDTSVISSSSNEQPSELQFSGELWTATLLRIPVA
jgi:hypothetical protein